MIAHIYNTHDLDAARQDVAVEDVDDTVYHMQTEYGADDYFALFYASMDAAAPTHVIRYESDVEKFVAVELDIIRG